MIKAILAAALILCGAAGAAAQGVSEAPIPLLTESRFLVGVNYPWHTQDGLVWFGNLFGEMTDQHKAAITAEFREMSKAGIRCLRFWVLAGGGRWPERTGGTFQPLPEKFIEDFRWFVREAARFGIFSMPSIWDFYVNRDHRDWVADDATATAAVQVAVAPMVKALASEPGILIWDVMNEPEWLIRGRSTIKLKAQRAKFLDRLNLGPDVGTGHDLSRVRSFLQKNVDAVHAAGGRATVGAVSVLTVRLWKSLGLDEYQIHFYPIGEKSRVADDEFYAIPRVKYLKLDRPVMLGEFPPNINGLDLVSFFGRMRDFGYSGVLAWSWFGAGHPEDRSHAFSVKNRIEEFRRFTGGH